VNCSLDAVPGYYETRLVGLPEGDQMRPVNNSCINAR
jgi:hypothetical protein